MYICLILIGCYATVLNTSPTINISLIQLYVREQAGIILISLWPVQFSVFHQKQEIWKVCRQGKQDIYIAIIANLQLLRKDAI